jgi:hypothetical protein
VTPCVAGAAPQQLDHPLQAEHDDATTLATGDQETRYESFRQMLNGTRLVGKFTILGKENRPLAEEQYTIQSVTKMPQGDYWMFQARIRYGKVDVTLPLPLEVKWAGDTPVITLTRLTLPQLGTFSSRVVLYNGKYAGTWTHDEVTGHLFGVIEKLEQPAEEETESND